VRRRGHPVVPGVGLLHQHLAGVGGRPALNTLFTLYTVFWYSLSRCMCVT
jgi:hypothetical protein